MYYILLIIVILVVVIGMVSTQKFSAVYNEPVGNSFDIPLNDINGKSLTLLHQTPPTAGETITITNYKNGIITYNDTNPFVTGATLYPFGNTPISTNYPITSYAPVGVTTGLTGTATQTGCITSYDASRRGMTLGDNSPSDLASAVCAASGASYTN